MKKYVAGVDVGATHTKIAILNLRGQIIDRDSFLTRYYNKKTLIKAISRSLDKLITKRRLKKRDILGLGIGVPGLVDFKKGLVFYFVNIPGWKNIRLKDEIERSIGLPAFVDNDVKVMALGELTFGAGKNYKNIICLTLGTGVGGAVITNGELYRGSSLVAGEIGHIPINEKGPLCNCGNSGCLEAYVGREYFLNDARKDLRKGAKSIVRIMIKNRLSDITPELFEEAARKGDSFAKRKWREFGEHIGNALVGVVNLLNPELIIIGGGIAEAERFFIGSIKKTLNKKAMKVQKKTVKIIKAKLSNDAGVIGAAELVKRNLL
jgi:glucokinase